MNRNLYKLKKNKNKNHNQSYQISTCLNKEICICHNAGNYLASS